ncbi:MAG: hypothetical protein RLZZ297_94 [Chloroflexota bacterium]
MSEAPRAARHPVTLHLHGTPRTDAYGWLRDRANPAVRAHLAAENAYAAAVIDQTLVDALVGEMAARLPATDTGAPRRIGAHTYQFRTAAGADYPVLVRWLTADPTQTQTVIDVAALAVGTRYCVLGDWQVSPDGTRVAYLLDTDGSERFTLHIRTIADGTPCAAPLADLYYGIAWSPDSQIVYLVQPDEAWRPCQVIGWRYTTAEPAQILFHEADERFNVWLRTSGDQHTLIIGSESSQTSEIWLCDAQDSSRMTCVVPRVTGVLADVAVAGERLYLQTNADAVNFCVRTRLVDESAWQSVVPHRSDTTIEHVTAFASGVVLWIRRDGLPGIEFFFHGKTELQRIEMPDAAYALGDPHTSEYATDTLVYEYATPVHPRATYAYELGTRHQTLRHRETLACAHDPADYRIQRLAVNGRDGTAIPLTVVTRADFVADSSAPALQLGYGAYGANLSLGFFSERLSLLDRGVVLAFAHVRGGGENGREWYLDGKLAHKQHTFDDFIDCGRYLVAQGYTSSARFACFGRSAGGLLVGAVITQAPELFRAAIALVPFVDVINTMCDASIPLTVPEYEEWGDPNDPVAAATMTAYAPYENVRCQPYPALLTTASLNDPRVPFWEPAKWVAALRATNPDGTFLLVTDADAGHAGKSGRYARFSDRATEYAFLCHQLQLSRLPQPTKDQP